MSTELRNQLQKTLGSSYTLERELGGGGMSRVFVAEEHALGRKVVVKVLPPELAAGVSVDRFKREISFAAQLQHPHILPVLAAGETDGLPYYTMPLVEGESLRARLASGDPLPCAEAVHVLSDVAKALSHAHARGVIHRDIKPDNVLMSGGAAVVTDFGVAKALASAMTESRPASNATMLTGMGMTMGTPAYMAPEQAAADPDADHRLDIYAFGVMAYELLTGAPPFTGGSIQSLLAAHLSESPEPVSDRCEDLPPSLSSLVMACLEKDPANRPQSALELVQRLEGVSLSGDAIAAGRGYSAVKVSPTAALIAFAVGAAAVALLAKAAVVGLGLPDWVFTGALVVLALGFPPLLLAVVSTRTTTRGTPGGSVSARGAAASGGTRSTAARSVRRRPWLTWQRAATMAVVLIVAYATLVGGVVALGALGLGPAKSLLAAGVLEERGRVIVADFTVSGADTALGTVITEAFRTDIAQSSVVSVVPASSVRDGLRRMEREETRLDAATALELARRDGVPAIITGDIAGVGGSYVLTARLVSAETGDALASVRETAGDQRELLAALDRVSKGLRERIGESMRTVRAKPPLEQVTTASLPALQKYAQAVRLIDGEGEYERGITLLEEALALDTAFAMAYRKLAVTYGNVGRNFEGTIDLLTKAYTHRNRLTPLERYLTEGSYYGSVVGSDRGKAIESYLGALEIDPHNTTAHNNIAGQYSAAGDHEKAAEHYRRAAEAEPNHPLYRFNLVSAELARGRPEEAAAVYDSARARFPRHRMAYAPAPILAYSRFGANSAEAAYQWIRASEDAPADVRVGAISGLTNIYMLQGRLSEGERSARETWAENAARGEPRIELSEETSYAMLDVWMRDNPARGLQKIEAALRRHPLSSYSAIRRPYLQLAMAFAMAGAPDRARAIMREYDSATDLHEAQRRAQAPGQQRVQAEVALAEGRHADAIREIRNYDNECQPCEAIELGRAFDLAGTADSAITHYERYVQLPPSIRMHYDPTFLPLAYRRLGDLYANRGDTRGAREMYSAFVELWARADADLQPLVADVRRRIRELDVER